MTTSAIIAAYLRRELPDVPLTERDEDSGYAAGINVYPFTRTELPSAAYPYRGTAVHVMYEPRTTQENYAEAWVQATREKLMARYGHRWRPMSVEGPAWFLIENPNTRYSRARRADYVTRAQMGWAPLHTIGK